MIRLIRDALLVFSIFLFAACQPLPHPFEDEQLPPDAPILAVPEVYGVVVEPIVNAPSGAGPAIQRAMVQALQDTEIPATIGISNKRSFRLMGTVTAAQMAAHSGNLTLRWVLKDSTGVQKGDDQQDINLSTTGAIGGKSEANNLMPGLMRNEARRIAAFIATPGPADQHLERRIYIPPVKNAPGDGAVSLARSLGYLISKAGYTVTENAAATGTIKIQGQIFIAPAPDNQQQVQIVWHVLSPKGSEIGQVSQENTIAKGSLDGPWSEIAMAVASAARDDLIGLIGRVPETSS